MMESVVIVEGHQRRGVAVVSLNRPEQHNALNRQLVEQLTGAFTEIAVEKSVKAVILTGKGRSFCAGADLASVQASSEAGYDAALLDGLGLYDLMTAVSHCPKPVIGRVDGWVVGGGMGLVSCCDLVAATERARFGFSEVRLGLIPAVITPFVLSRIHVREARKTYLTGERFDASEARRIGLVDQVVSEDGLDEQVEMWLEALLQGAPGAQAAVKALLSDIAFRREDQLRQYTSDLFASRVVSEEGREGINAFLEKRRTDWDDGQ